MDITLRVLQEQLKTCWRMKAHYDLLNFETHIVSSKLWSKAFELLKSNGIAKYETEGKNKGCWVIESKENKKDEDKVLVRSDGTATYIAKDIPYAAWKLGLVEDPFYYSEYTQQWDGSWLYSTDLVAGINKSFPDNTFNGGERVITIIDSRQSRLQRIISHVLSKIGVISGNGHNRSEEHTSELQSRQYLVCRLLLEKKKRLRHHALPQMTSACTHKSISE